MAAYIGVIIPNSLILPFIDKAAEFIVIQPVEKLILIPKLPVKTPAAHLRGLADIFDRYFGKRQPSQICFQALYQRFFDKN